MSDLPAIADRVEIEALRGEFTVAGMMRDHDRVASLFTRDAVWRIPVVNVEFIGREEIRIPRPLPAHPGRLKVHRTRRRDQVSGHHSAGGLAAPEGNHDRQHSTIGVMAPVDYDRTSGGLLRRPAAGRRSRMGR